ncbi:alpha/beta hydrolase (plasmid) [Streptomyces sp. BI20]|uniref:alpha/beta hydrolase n=1 Tax=Streptomyces sp. BI20 TaxID=3403460 RepID=UPI003C72A32F
MSLTGGALLACVLALTALLFAGAILAWPRLGRPGPLRVLGRVGLIALIQVCVLASAGLVANRAFLLYDSWADLAGTRPARQATTGGAAVQILGRIPARTPGGAKPQAGGVVERVTVHGATSGAAAEALVYLPPEYFKAGAEHRRFPAAVVLTGYPGTAENLVKGLDYPKTAWNLSRQHRMEPTILVMTRPTISARNTQCVDVPGGPRAESFFGTDLVRAISGTYRTATGPAGWGIIGDSTGGYCALKVGLQHPETYSVGIGLSAEYRPEIDRDSGDLFHGNKAEENRSDLLWYLDHTPRKKGTSLLVTSSLQGEPNLRETREFVAKVAAPARVSSILLDSGGHNFKTWRREIPPALEWMGKRLTAGS